MTHRQARRVDEPRPGYFRMRLVRGGPFVTARIWEAKGKLHAHINAAPADVDRVWLFGHEIELAEYQKLMGRTLVKADEAPDLMRLPSPF